MKAGYKQTEVGIIPNDWIIPKIGDVFSFKNGLNKAKSYFGHGRPIINYMDVYHHRGLYSHDIRGLVDVNKQELEAYNVQKGDVFFTRTSETVAEIGLTSVVLDDVKNTVFSGFILRARPKNSMIDDQYKKYCFSSAAVRHQIMSKSTYTTRALINGRLLSTLLCPLPASLTEQTAIATALSDTDELIQSLEKLISKKRLIKQGTLQELLTGKKRLSGCSGAWRKTALGNIGKFSKGRGIKKDEVSLEGLACIRYGEIYTCFNSYVKNCRSFISQDIAMQSLKIKKGDLLFAGSGETAEEIGKCVAFLGEYEAYAGGDIIVFTPQAQDSMYLGYLMNHTSVTTQKAKMGQGDAVVHISARNLGQIEFWLPPIDEQQRISTTLFNMDAELAALEAKLDKYRQIKQGMLQELLTGRIRLV